MTQKETENRFVQLVCTAVTKRTWSDDSESLQEEMNKQTDYTRKTLHVVSTWCFIRECSMHFASGKYEMIFVWV